MAAALRFGIFLISASRGTALLACSVCGYASEASQSAFILTTALLSFAPLTFIGVVVWYLKKKFSDT